MECSLSLKAKSESDDEKMTMFVRRFTKFFKKEKSEKRGSRNKNKSSEKEQFQGCFKCGKMDHMIKDRPLLKEEQRKISKKQQELTSKAFKNAMKDTWGETFDEESEREDGESNLALMAKSDTDSDKDSSEENEEELEIGLVPSSTYQVSAAAQNEGTLLETNSLNVPSEPRQELENSGGTNPVTMVVPEEGTGEETSSDPVPEIQNDNPQELILRPWKHQSSHPLDQ
ncbi:hypothetical protein HAX54_029176 [Datura stramonium]|uniref:Uncharacterized protein n=1 Tax=Datura stramonium TaxID=4076 RepID=A0ABS8SA53_DATST|nr:hypothetical protein [Datura stramonium]